MAIKSKVLLNGKPPFLFEPELAGLGCSSITTWGKYRSGFVDPTRVISSICSSLKSEVSKAASCSLRRSAFVEVLHEPAGNSVCDRKDGPSDQDSRDDDPS